MRIRHKIFLVISLATLALDAAFVAINHWQARRALMESLQVEGRAMQWTAESSMALTLTNMLQLATFVAHNPQVEQTFLEARKAVAAEGGGAGGPRAARIRDEMMDLVAPAWAEMTARFYVRQLHFHFGPGSLSFLRVHQPDRFGDRMDDVRHIIVEVNETLEERQGFETGRIYSGLRGVVPVFARDPDTGEKVHVGALEAGTSFHGLLQELDRRIGAGVAVLLRKEHVAEAMWTDFITRHLPDRAENCDCYIEASSRDGLSQLVRAPGFRQDYDGVTPLTYLVEANNGTFAVTRFPLRDYKADREPGREPVGSLVIWRDAGPRLADLAAQQRFNILFAVVAFVAFELLLAAAFKAVSTGLERTVQRQTAEIRTIQGSLSNAQRIARLGNWDWDLRSGRLWWSDEIYRIFGLERESCAAGFDGFLACVHPDDRERVRTVVQQALDRRQSYDIHHRVLRPDGTVAIVREQGEVSLDAGGAVTGMTGTVQDVTEEKQREERLRTLWSAIQQVPVAVFLTGLDGTIRFANPAVARITGFPLDQVTGQTPRLFKSGHHAPSFYATLWQTIFQGHEWRGELRNRRPDGGLYWVETVISPIRDEDGALSQFLAVQVDVTERKDMQARIEHMAFHDPLTGLPNRTLFQEKLRHGEAWAQRNGMALALIYIDLDGFKPVNDRLGHQAGDRLLVLVARLLQGCLREVDSLARLGGDEFAAALVVERDRAADHAAAAAERMIQSLARPIDLGGTMVTVGASIGIALWPAAATQADECLRLADMAMYQAKRSGKNRYVLHDIART